MNLFEKKVNSKIDNNLFNIIWQKAYNINDNKDPDAENNPNER
jgi:hypothetical protein